MEKRGNVSVLERTQVSRVVQGKIPPEEYVRLWRTVVTFERLVFEAAENDQRARMNKKN